MKYYLHVIRSRTSEGIREGEGTKEEIREQLESLFDKEEDEN